MELMQIEDEITEVYAPELTLTTAAAARVRGLIEEKGLEDHALRVFVSGGGCSGLNYGMAIEGNLRPDDLMFQNEGVDVVVDPASMGYLAGCSIDYVDDLMGGGFRVDNPNAVASCGCGHSFRTESEGAATATATDSSCC